MGALVVLGVAACSGESNKGGFGTTQHEPVAVSEAYEEVVAQDWNVEPGMESYYCVYKTLTEDLMVQSFRPVQPLGTHHVTLGFSDPGRPDGVVLSTDSTAMTRCSGTTVGDTLVYFSGVGSGDMNLPEGVAVRIPAGKQVLLNIHVINTTDHALGGHSGLEILAPDPASVLSEAEIVAAGKVGGLDVPPGRSTQTGTCTMRGDVTILAVLPHMHAAGVHMTTTAIGADATTTLIDTDFQVDEQAYTFLDPPVALRKNETVKITCEYENGSAANLKFGENLGDEMCYAFMYRYPSLGASYVCVE